MTSKLELVAAVLSEFEIAQREPWVPPKPGPVRQIRFPPLLPTGQLKQLPATDELLKIIHHFARLILDERSRLKSAVKAGEWFEVVRRCFGATLDNLYAKSGRPSPEALLSTVEKAIEREIRQLRRDIRLDVGCWLFEEVSLYPVQVGPVRFQRRDAWLDEALSTGEISRVTHRRLTRLWSGSRVRPRRANSRDVHDEGELADAVGRAPVICSILMNGLSSKLILEKGLQAARLAMGALSLMWDKPSRGLEWMNLLYDGDVYRRRYVLFSDGRNVGSGSSISRLPQGYRRNGELGPLLADYEPFFDQAGKALNAYLRPHDPVDRPRLMNALFLSLWWFYQACRESSDQMATTKFAASLDALAGGGKARGIIQLVEARLGTGPAEPMMQDGRTSRQVVEKIYNAGRSRLIHGSSDDYAQDWSDIRATAETLSRECLVEVCSWMSRNPLVDSIEAVRE